MATNQSANPPRGECEEGRGEAAAGRQLHSTHVEGGEGFHEQRIRLCTELEVREQAKEFQKNGPNTRVQCYPEIKGGEEKKMKNCWGSHWKSWVTEL